MNNGPTGIVVIIGCMLFRLRKRLPVERTKVVSKLGYLNRPVDGNVAKDLSRFARAPVDLEYGNPVGLSKTDRLMKRIASEAAPRRNVAINGHWLHALRASRIRPARTKDEPNRECEVHYGDGDRAAFCARM